MVANPLKITLNMSEWKMVMQIVNKKLFTFPDNEQNKLYKEIGVMLMLNQEF
jgi:hypothetical protein